MPLAQSPSPSAVAELGMSGGQGIFGFDLTSQEYQEAYALYSGQRGYQLADLWGYVSDNAARYAAIWEECPGHPDQFTQHAIVRSDYQSVFNDRHAQGYAPMRVSGYTVDRTTMYAAIWEKAAGPAWAARHNFVMDNLANHQREVRQMGYRIADLDAYLTFEPSPDFPDTPPTWVPRFSSIWVESDGRDWMVSLPVNIGAYQNLFNQLTAEGWWPAQVSAFGSTPRIIARWERPRGLMATARHGIGSAAFLSELATQDAAGQRPAWAGAYNQINGGVAPPQFCPLWQRRDAEQVVPGLVEAFLRGYEIPGISLAVAREGRLMYAAGFGVADQATGDVVEIPTRFRIASVTKPITATAVIRLVAQQALALDDTVFGSGGHLSALGTPIDPRVTQITVRHLLQHGSGGWTNDANDPMFTNPTLSARELITTVLATRPLDHAPGTAYAYSNFGYCVLGRVIEEVTGETYEDHVRQNILVPCGSSMAIAGNTLADRQPNEVVYHGLDGADPYGMQVSRMDSHGGWISTAVDLLRFLVRVDGLPSVRDILRLHNIMMMTTPSGLPGSNGYAAGWQTNVEGTWWHTGSLPGTRSILVRTADGYCWAALVNSGRDVPGDSTRDTLTGLDALMWAVREKVDFWPFSGTL